jgi:hypothetical protein
VNAPKVVAGVAVLVLALFWAFLLHNLLGSIGDLMILVTPFVILLAIGFYGIIDGLGALSVQPRGSQPSRSGRRLGILDMTILQMTAQGKNQQEIAAATAVSPTVISEKVEALTKAGFLFENALSEKGFEVLKA